MAKRPAATTVPRLLMLCFMLLGIAGMHTLGHATHEDQVLAAAATQWPGDTGHIDHTSPPAGDSTAPAEDPQARLGGSADEDGRHSTDPLTVCLAVLMALAVMMGMNLLAKADVLGTRALPGRRGIRSADTRGPPRLGLLLKQTVVLRT